MSEITNDFLTRSHGTKRVVSKGKLMSCGLISRISVGLKQGRTKTIAVKKQMR